MRISVRIIISGIPIAIRIFIDGEDIIAIVIGVQVIC